MITVDEVFKILRTLARGNYYQTIYSQEKNLGLRLFKNSNELTVLQNKFLHFLGFYSSLFLDFSLGEIGEIVFENEIYEDAYMYYKHKMREESKTEVKLDKLKKKQEIPISKSQWVFKSKKKGV
jgi:hypothetical protein